MINAKQTKTFSMIICNEKDVGQTRKFHYKCRFKTMNMLAITLQNLDLYPGMDHRQVKVINVDYNVKMEYWA